MEIKIETPRRWHDSRNALKLRLASIFFFFCFVSFSRTTFRDSDRSTAIVNSQFRPPYFSRPCTPLPPPKKPNVCLVNKIYRRIKEVRARKIGTNRWENWKNLLWCFTILFYCKHSLFYFHLTFLIKVIINIYIWFLFVVSLHMRWASFFHSIFHWRTEFEIIVIEPLLLINFLTRLRVDFATQKGLVLMDESKSLLI